MMMIVQHNNQNDDDVHCWERESQSGAISTNGKDDLHHYDQEVQEGQKKIPRLQKYWAPNTQDCSNLIVVLSVA